VTYLLDINVLVALFDPAHLHHDPAHQWFRSIGRVSWSTCPLTEIGLVRVLSNPGYTTVSANPEEIVARLRIFCRLAGHVFWPMAVSLTDALRFDVSKLSGHQQITDLYPVGLAASYGGKLATFDTRIPVTALRGVAGAVENIPA